MLSLLKTRFKDCRLVRVSSGDWCVIRDLGPVKGGKGLKHHDVVLALYLRRVSLRRLRLVALPPALKTAGSRVQASLGPANLGSIRRAFQVW